MMNELIKVQEVIEEVTAEMCDHFCKWPGLAKMEGHPDDYLICAEDSPCKKCPLDRLGGCE